MKKILFPILLAALFAACKNEPKPDMQAVQGDGSTLESKSVEELRTMAIAESDLFGRVEKSLVVLQKAYQKAEGKIPGVGKVTVFVDKNFVMLLKNENKGDVTETKVDLKCLDPNQGGMSLIIDEEFPGLKMNVLSGREGVEIRKNNELVSEERELKIYMPDRASIEQITPAMVQALNIVHGKN